MPIYNVELFKQDGTRSIILKTDAPGLSWAILRTQELLDPPLSYAEIWDGSERVRVLHKIDYARLAEANTDTTPPPKSKWTRRN